jgi:hypothetical protein
LWYLEERGQMLCLDELRQRFRIDQLSQDQ